MISYDTIFFLQTFDHFIVFYMYLVSGNGSIFPHCNMNDFFFQNFKKNDFKSNQDFGEWNFYLYNSILFFSLFFFIVKCIS